MISFLFTETKTPFSQTIRQKDATHFSSYAGIIRIRFSGLKQLLFSADDQHPILHFICIIDNTCYFVKYILVFSMICSARIKNSKQD